MLRKLLDQEIARRGVSYREIAREIGTSHTTLFAIGKRPIMVDTANAVCKWIGVPLQAAVDEPEDQLYAVVAKIFADIPQIRSILLETAQTEQLSHEDFEDIVEYVAFKLFKSRITRNP